MTILRDISVMWSLIHTLVMFMFLFDSRYSKKKTIKLTLLTMLPLILLNFIMFLVCGSEGYMQRMLITLSLPSLIFFFILAKHRDGRFLFTFCVIDTLVLEIIYITNIIDHYIPGYWFMFTVRLLAYPLLEWFVIKKFKAIYHDIQNQVKKGWGIFALIGLMFYVAITLAMSYPTTITDRPEYLPVFVLLLILMPVSYIHIFTTLRHQQNVYRAKEQENILRVQVSDIKSRIEEFSVANDKFSKERHDFRHKLQTISRLVETKQYDELLVMTEKYGEALDETKVKRYCENAVLDAVFSSYLGRAENSGIRVTTSIRFPEEIPISDIELATVFANAIENAIHACEKIPAQNRWIDIKVIFKPKFMFQISNGYDGNAEFDENGIPVTKEEGHGFGTRSIVAFCEKHNSYYNFEAKEDSFVLQIDF